MGSSKWWVRRRSGFEEWVFWVSGFQEWRGRLTSALGISRRTSLVLGRSRTRSVLGGSILGGDDLDGGTDELPATTMGPISSVLGATRRCFWWIGLALSLSLSLCASEARFENGLK